MGRGTSEKWFAVGRSSHAEAATAGTEAATEASAAGVPKLAVAFASCEYDLEALLAGIRDELGAIPLIGCSTAGEIARTHGVSGFHNQTLVVLAVA